MRRMVETILKQRFPFRHSDLLNRSRRFTANILDRLALINKVVWIPGSSAGHRTEHCVIADFPIPVLAVPKIAFQSMHDCVPEASFGGVDFLADLMRLIEKIVQQPKAGQATLCQILIGIPIGEKIIDRQSAEERFQVAIGSRNGVLLKRIPLDQIYRRRR